MPGFRRVQLRGSDELFRTTEEPLREATLPEPTVHPVPAAPGAELRSVRLSSDEVTILADAVQHLKFPNKTPARPSIGDFERLEALRQKLLQTL
ncbi:MAG TPA: hypothetical protein VEK76_09415 [Candidatus Binatia bacterium]|nr:hypothetical protein [Candidatus Binatia bacterium]